MHILLFFLNAICYAGQSGTGKLYAAKGGQAESFNFSKALAAAALFFIWVLVRGGIHWQTLPPAVLYSLFLTLSMHTGFQALSCGPMALTGILVAMSLVIPMFWGLLFWQETLSVWEVFGVTLLLAAIVLIQFKKQGGLSARWLMYCLITMVANGLCSVVQKYHQRAFPGLYQPDFMLFATATVAIVFTLTHMLQKGKPVQFPLLGICSGVCNGLANFFVLILAASQQAVALFPLISAGNVLCAWLTGVLFFKEHIQPMQLLGLACGALGLIVMNL